MKSKCTNLCLFAPHIQVLALSFGEMVPCLLFGSSLEYRHNLFNCGGVQGRTRDHPETERERKRGQVGRSRGVRKWSQLGICKELCECVYGGVPYCSVHNNMGIILNVIEN